jgi:hypothetical protein
VKNAVIARPYVPRCIYLSIYLHAPSRSACTAGAGRPEIFRGRNAFRCTFARERVTLPSRIRRRRSNFAFALEGARGDQEGRAGEIREIPRESRGNNEEAVETARPPSLPPSRPRRPPVGNPRRLDGS